MRFQRRILATGKNGKRLAARLARICEAANRAQVAMEEFRRAAWPRQSPYAAARFRALVNGLLNGRGMHQED